MGITEGTAVGISVGLSVGTSVGVDVGISVGTDVGVSVGVDVGISVGADVGVSVGADVGVSVGEGSFSFVVLKSPSDPQAVISIEKNNKAQIFVEKLVPQRSRPSILSSNKNSKSP